MAFSGAAANLPVGVFVRRAVERAGATEGATTGGADVAATPFQNNWAKVVGGPRETPAGMMVLEGSRTALPPVAADATVLVLRSIDRPDRGFGIYRLLLADL